MKQCNFEDYKWTIEEAVSAHKSLQGLIILSDWVGLDISNRIERNGVADDRIYVGVTCMLEGVNIGKWYVYGNLFQLNYSSHNREYYQTAQDAMLAVDSDLCSLHGMLAYGLRTQLF